MVRELVEVEEIRAEQKGAFHLPNANGRSRSESLCHGIPLTELLNARVDLGVQLTIPLRLVGGAQFLAGEG